MDVLRHRLFQEMRRRAAATQIEANKQMMASVGKRKKRNSPLSDVAISQHLINQWVTIHIRECNLLGLIPLKSSLYSSQQICSNKLIISNNNTIIVSYSLNYATVAFGIT